jgi:hypothetical protein
VGCDGGEVSVGEGWSEETPMVEVE